MYHGIPSVDDLEPLSRVRVHVLSSTVGLVATGTAGGGLLLLEAALVGEPTLDAVVLAGCANLLQASGLLLAAVLSVVSQLDAGLALQGLAEAGMHIRRGSAVQGVGGGGVGSLLAVATEHIGVVGLAAHLAGGVGSEGVAGGCGARRESLQVVDGALVGLVNLDAGLVL